MAHFADAALLVDEDEVDRELHEEGVNRQAGDDPEAFAFLETGMLEQTDVALTAGVGDRDGIAQQGAAGLVTHVDEQSSRL